MDSFIRNLMHQHCYIEEQCTKEWKNLDDRFCGEQKENGETCVFLR